MSVHPTHLYLYLMSTSLEGSGLLARFTPSLPTIHNDFFLLATKTCHVFYLYVNNFIKLDMPCSKLGNLPDSRFQSIGSFSLVIYINIFLHFAKQNYSTLPAHLASLLSLSILLALNSLSHSFYYLKVFLTCCFLYPFAVS